MEDVPSVKVAVRLKIVQLWQNFLSFFCTSTRKAIILQNNWKIPEGAFSPLLDSTVKIRKESGERERERAVEDMHHLVERHTGICSPAPTAVFAKE